MRSSFGGSLRYQALACAAFALPSCSLFVTIPASLTEPPAGAGEAGPSTGDAASPAADATSAAGDAGPFACAPTGSARFCDDFDHGAPFATWDRTIQGPGYGASVDTAIVETAPGALLGHVDSTVTNDCAYGRVEKEIAGAFTRVRLAVSLRAEGPEEIQDEALATLGVSQPGKDIGCVALVVVHWDGAAYTLQLYEQTLRGSNVDNQIHDVPIRMPPKTWQRVDVELDYAGRTIVLRDGAGATVHEDALKLACAASPGAADVTVGLHCSHVAAYTRRMRADDVVFDAR